jgi:hypothetical protein
MNRCAWMSCLFALSGSPLAAQVYTGTRAEKFQGTLSTVAGPRLVRENLPVSYIGVRGSYLNGGATVDIFFDAVPDATTYTLRSSSASGGPYTTLPPSQARLTTNNYLANPPCCEIMDVEAYKAGVGQTVWYAVDAWNGSSLIKSSSPIRMDLPDWFRGPLGVSIAKTGTDQWTVGWEPVSGATSYLVWVQIYRTNINLLYNANVPPGQTQINLGGLSSGTQYRIYVSGDLMWNGQKAYRYGETVYTAP